MSGKYDRLAVMIAKAREARGWSQADLAQLTYMSDAAIANVEAGRPTNRAALSAVEQALGWLPGMFDYVLGQGAGAPSGSKAGAGRAAAAAVAAAADGGDDVEPGEDGAAPGAEDDEFEEYEDEDESAQIRELVADSTIDWA